MMTGISAYRAGTAAVALAAFAAGSAAAQRRAGTTDSGLSYETAGTGPAVVLVHAFSVDRRMWDPQVDALARAYRVVRYDLRGHGRSAGPDGPYTSFDDLRSVLDAAEVAQAVVVGLSAGAEVAIDFALTHPERVSALVLAAPGLGGFRTPPLPWAAPAFQAAAAGRPDSAAARWARTPIMALRRRPEAQAGVTALVTDNAALWSLRRTEVRLDPPAIGRLREIGCPVLVVVGADDLPHVREVATLVADGVARGRLVTIPGAGHLVSLDAPDEFAQLLLTFLAESAPR